MTINHDDNDLRTASCAPIVVVVIIIVVVVVPAFLALLVLVRDDCMMTMGSNKHNTFSSLRTILLYDTIFFVVVLYNTQAIKSRSPHARDYQNHDVV
jgi:hypothetical protein